jgi:FkbM family methyltransferase
MLFRAALERISRRVVLKRKLPASFNRVPLYVTPASALSYWRTDLADSHSILLDVARRHIGQNQVVWDIGANVGVFSFAAASLVGSAGRVLCVEPDAWLVRLLLQSAMLRENNNLSMDILPTAVTDRLDIVKLNIARRGRAANYVSGSLGSSQTGGVRNTQLVPSVSLDWLLDRYPKPHFVKIDVEGSEYKVLSGATRLLAEVKPVIFCEVASELSEGVARILGRNGYSLFDIGSGQQISLGPSSAAWNTLAYPAGFSV